AGPEGGPPSKPQNGKTTAVWGNCHEQVEPLRRGKLEEIALERFDVFSVSGNDGRFQLAGIDEKVGCRGGSHQAQQPTPPGLDLKPICVLNRLAIDQDDIILQLASDVN